MVFASKAIKNAKMVDKLTIVNFPNRQVNGYSGYYNARSVQGVG